MHQSGSTTLDGASYGYDLAGNRTSKTNQRTAVTEGYGYDLIYQLTQVTQGASTTESYSYDAVGNRLSSLGVNPYSYNTSNELTATPSGSYTYDNNGNTLTAPGGKSYTWDFENRLVQAVVPGTGTTTFKYDIFGRRIQKSGPLGTTNYLYDGANPLEEVDQSGNVLAKYTQSAGVDAPLAMLRSSGISYYEQDGLNSVSSLSNPAGTLANTYSYDSFGTLTSSTGTIANAFRYTGREFDPETGEYFYRARYYDQSVGRFVSEDKNREGLEKSLYDYVGNNPGIFVDPSGLVARLYCDIIPTGRGRTLGQRVGLAIAHPTHCYLYVSCHGSGHYLELYGPPANGHYGIPHNDQPFNIDRAHNSTEHTLSPPAGMKCCEFENRLLSAFDHQAANLPEYNASGPNSNTFANSIIQEAGGRGDFPWNAYGWNYGFPPPSPAESLTMPSCCGAP